MTTVKYEEMRPDQINAILRETPLAYLVWGAHEWHGVHNAIGLDTIKAYEMTQRLAQRTGGVVLPPVYCGYQTMKPWGGFHHTFEFSKGLVTQYVFEHLENLYDEGFKAIVVVMGHYGAKHVEAVKAGVAQFTEKHRLPKVLAITDYEPASWVDVKGGDHAGRNETSLLMYLRPELVDLSRLPAGELDHPRDGITVDAKEATPEHGEYLVGVFLEQAEPRVRALLREAVEGWPTHISRGE